MLLHEVSENYASQELLLLNETVFMVTVDVDRDCSLWVTRCGRRNNWATPVVFVCGTSWGWRKSWACNV